MYTVEEKLEILKSDLVDIRISFSIWEKHTNIENRDRYEPIYEKYRTFFRSVIRTHFQDIVITMYRVFETRNDTVNFSSLMAQMKEEYGLEKKDAMEIRNKYKLHWPKICELRSAIFAHRNDSKTPAEIYSRASISPNKLKDQIDSFEHVFNNLYFRVKKSTFMFEYVDWVETENLMEVIIDGNR